MMWAHVWISVYQKEMQAVNNQKNKTRKPHTSRQKHPLDFLKRNHRKLLEIQVSLVQILFSYDTFIRHCHFDLGNPLFRCLDDLAVRGNHSWLSLMHCFKKPSPKAAMGSRRVGHDWATELNWTEICQRKMHKWRKRYMIIEMFFFWLPYPSQSKKNMVRAAL